MKTGKFWAALLLVLTLASTARAAFVGTVPEVGKAYYLYNVYQGKFLSYGNAWGTQVSLVPFGNERALLCTLERGTGSRILINTHYSLTHQAWDAGVDNWIYKAQDETTRVPVVDACYGSDDDNRTSRTPTQFRAIACPEGYLLIDNASDTLRFQDGNRCTFDKLPSTAIREDMGLWRFIPEDDYKALLAKKRFVAVALNVDGLPSKAFGISMNPDSKGANGARAISQKLSTMGYDVIGVSEDFNYNSEICSALSDYTTGTWRGGIEGAGGLFGGLAAILGGGGIDTDGLNFFTRNSVCSQSNERWTKWNKRNGTTSDGNDELIKKGYRYYTVTMNDGVAFDVYIMHMDAETSSGDLAARESQMQQLVADILGTDNRRPIIVMGDTNCRYTRDRMKALFIDAIEADPRFTIRDAWVEAARMGGYPGYGADALLVSDNGYRRGEVVDKVFYINNTDAEYQLQAEIFAQDISFIGEDGEPLADHWPMVVTFSYEKKGENPGEEPDDKFVAQGVYLRAAGGGFLKAAGMWGTHAAIGDYGMPLDIAALGNGQYTLATGRGGGFVNGTDPYVDGDPFAWKITEVGDYVVFSTGSVSLARGGQNRYATNSVGPNTYQVTTASTNTRLSGQQWQIYTLADLKNQMQDATETKPINCTFLLPGANFDRNDGEGIAQWQWTAGSDWSRKGNRSTDGYFETTYGNGVYEVYIGSDSSVNGGSNTTWSLFQEIRDLPNGHYVVQCQGFYRDGDNGTGGAQHARLFASCGGDWQEARLPLVQSQPQATAVGKGNEVMVEGGYVPNDMASASQYFVKGLYLTKIEVNVTDGTLRLGVEKDGKTKSTSSWTCFDNFQIFYLGAKVDGIAAPAVEASSTGATLPLYDLSGRRLTHVSSRHGVYIQSGKKVVR
ncbi:MAG: hypothetical protein IJ064_01745 [Bacteroidaceae bacterium]|nr:hypothetical protein [Bacteroidaceae bacterium]